MNTIAIYAGATHWVRSSVCRRQKKETLAAHSDAQGLLRALMPVVSRQPFRQESS